MEGTKITLMKQILSCSLSRPNLNNREVSVVINKAHVEALTMLHKMKHWIQEYHCLH